MSLMKPDYTPRQGRFLAFIHQYILLHQRAPSEADFGEFFHITPPSVHSMILTLERRGFIKRVPGQPRSITLLMPPEFLPSLETQNIGSVPKEGKNGFKLSGWGALRKQMDSRDKRELFDLLQALYGLSHENRDFIAARLQAGADAGEALEKYRARIVNQFFPKRVMANSSWEKRGKRYGITVRRPGT